MGLLAFIGHREIQQLNQDSSEIRIDRASRAAAALFEQYNEEFVVDCATDGSPVMIKIDTIDRLEPAPTWDALTDTVSSVNQGAANIFRLDAATQSFDRISTSFKDESGNRIGGSQVEPGLIVEGHPAYSSIVDGVPYVGEVPVAGRLRYAYLTPIVDADFSVVGILAVDVGWVDDLQVNDDRAARRVLIAMGGLLLAMAVSGMGVMYFAFRPMNRLIKVAHDVGSDLRPASIELTSRRDEIGYLATGLSKVVDLQRDLEHRAYTDLLTSIPNRAAFVRELDRRLSAMGQLDHPTVGSFALMIIDLDGFKEVNDALGHQAGDELLTSLTTSLSVELQPGEFLARLGGDEFALLTRQGIGDARKIEEVAQRASRCVAGVRPTRAGDTSMTASIGVALIPEHGDTIEAVMTHADLALYAVKRDGRGHVQTYDPSLSSPIQRRMHLATELRRALGERVIHLEYQPLYGAGDGRLRSVEALARWTHPVEGPIPPLEFVGVAEKVGLINELGAYVIEEACMQIARWRDRGELVPVVAINISTMQLWQPDFVDQLRSAMTRHDVAPGELCLELTESVVMQREDARHRHLLTEIAALGVCLSIDDFGTGYSSLSYLHDLPVQQVKIDRMFLAEATADPKRAQLFAGIVSLGLNLGLEVVAEGVETSADLAFARSHGCDLIQGFFLDAPIPADQVAARFDTIGAPWLSDPSPASALLV